MSTTPARTRAAPRRAAGPPAPAPTGRGGSSPGTEDDDLLPVDQDGGQVHPGQVGVRRGPTGGLDRVDHPRPGRQPLHAGRGDRADDVDHHLDRRRGRAAGSQGRRETRSRPACRRAPPRPVGRRAWSDGAPALSGGRLARGAAPPRAAQAAAPSPATRPRRPPRSRPRRAPPARRAAGRRRDRRGGRARCAAEAGAAAPAGRRRRRRGRRRRRCRRAGDRAGRGTPASGRRRIDPRAEARAIGGWRPRERRSTRGTGHEGGRRRGGRRGVTPTATKGPRPSRRCPPSPPDRAATADRRDDSPRRPPPPDAGGASAGRRRA